MENLTSTGRAFYAIGIAGIGVQQFIYGNFRPVLLPQWPSSFPWLAAWAYLAGAALIVAGAIIILSKNARKTALVLGTGFLLFFLLFHVGFLLFMKPDSLHFASWTNPLKELALSGGAFVIAGSYGNENVNSTSSFNTRLFNILVACGSIFFSITMIVFGIDHFMYTEFVATLVPTWIPGHVFWTYFAAVALIGSGLAIILRFKIRLVGNLLGTMLFIWFVILHIPRAITDPGGSEGNELTSVFEALAFSGIAFIIANLPRVKVTQSAAG